MEKENLISVLTERAEKHWQYGDIDTYSMLITLVKDIEEDRKTDYDWYEDIGMILKMEPSHHKLIEELEKNTGEKK